jgi:ABC-type ATPase with predicted acetyltransferase domain
MPVKVPFEFVAGHLYGFVEDNHLEELETCYKDDKGSFVMVENAIKAFEAGQNEQAIELIGDLVASLPADVSDCKAASAELKAVEDWASIFTNKKELISNVSKHFLLHKKAMTADITTLKSDWSQGEYFQAGDVAADLLTLAVGPVM